MNKITKFLLITCLILFVLCMLMLKYDTSLSDMRSKIGSKITGGELTMSDYYTLVQYMNMYKESIVHEKYELAYSFIGSSYKKYVSYEEFLKKIPQDMEKMQISDIERITMTTFNVLLDISGDKYEYSIVVDSDTSKFEILPDSFIDYQKVEKQEKNKELQCKLNDYIVNCKNCVFNLELNNTSSENIKIENVTLYTNLQDTIVNEESFEIIPDETKAISLTFNTDYAFPDKLIIVRSVGESEKTIEYTFDLSK